MASVESSHYELNRCSTQFNNYKKYVTGLRIHNRKIVILLTESIFLNLYSSQIFAKYLAAIVRGCAIVEIWQ